jgi:selT/selW/selH-like putative selenoprotein
LEREFGTSVRLIKGKDGVFEVEVDGRLVFSKRALGRFPDPGEVSDAIQGGR